MIANQAPTASSLTLAPTGLTAPVSDAHFEASAFDPTRAQVEASLAIQNAQWEIHKATRRSEPRWCQVSTSLFVRLAAGGRGRKRILRPRFFCETCGQWHFDPCRLVNCEFPGCTCKVKRNARFNYCTCHPIEAVREVHRGLQ